MNNSCVSCKWAKFDMTKHSPPRAKGPGSCEWPVPVIAWPLSLHPPRHVKNSIWPDYKNCPTFEAKGVEA